MAVIPRAQKQGANVAPQAKVMATNPVPQGDPWVNFGATLAAGAEKRFQEFQRVEDESFLNTADAAIDNLLTTYQNDNARTLSAGGGNYQARAKAYFDEVSQNILEGANRPETARAFMNQIVKKRSAFLSQAHKLEANARVAHAQVKGIEALDLNNQTLQNNPYAYNELTRANERIYANLARVMNGQELHKLKRANDINMTINQVQGLGKIDAIGTLDKLIKGDFADRLDAPTAFKLTSDLQKKIQTDTYAHMRNEINQSLDDENVTVEKQKELSTQFKGLKDANYLDTGQYFDLDNQLIRDFKSVRAKEKRINLGLSALQQNMDVRSVLDENGVTELYQYKLREIQNGYELDEQGQKPPVTYLDKLRVGQELRTQVPQLTSETQSLLQTAELDDNSAGALIEALQKIDNPNTLKGLDKLSQDILYDTAFKIKLRHSPLAALTSSREQAMPLDPARAELLNKLYEADISTKPENLAATMAQDFNIWQAVKADELVIDKSFVAHYAKLYNEKFHFTNGDFVRARQLAFAEMSRAYGVQDIDGVKEFVRFPAEQNNYDADRGHFLKNGIQLEKTALLENAGIKILSKPEINHDYIETRPLSLVTQDWVGRKPTVVEYEGKTLQVRSRSFEGSLRDNDNRSTMILHGLNTETGREIMLKDKQGQPIYIKPPLLQDVYGPEYVKQHELSRIPLRADKTFFDDVREKYARVENRVKKIDPTVARVITAIEGFGGDVLDLLPDLKQIEHDLRVKYRKPDKEVTP